MHEEQERGAVKVVGSTVYVLNDERKPSNLWWAMVQPGRDDEGRRLGQEACEAIANRIAAALTPEPAALPAEVFKTSVLGVGPYCVGFPDGEIIYTRSEDRARALAAALPVKLTDERIAKHTLSAKDCPPDSEVMLVSSLRRILAKGELSDEQILKLWQSIPAEEGERDLYIFARAVLALAAPAVQAEPDVCPDCHGSGEGVGMEGRGPDTYEVAIVCPKCNGSGEVPAAQSADAVDAPIVPAMVHETPYSRQLAKERAQKGDK